MYLPKQKLCLAGYVCWLALPRYVPFVSTDHYSIRFQSSGTASTSYHYAKAASCPNSAAGEMATSKAYPFNFAVFGAAQSDGAIPFEWVSPIPSSVLSPWTTSVEIPQKNSPCCSFLSFRPALSPIFYIPSDYPGYNCPGGFGIYSNVTASNNDSIGGSLEPISVSATYYRSNFICDYFFRWLSARASVHYCITCVYQCWFTFLLSICDLS